MLQRWPVPDLFLWGEKNGWNHSDCDLYRTDCLGIADPRGSSMKLGIGWVSLFSPQADGDWVNLGCMIEEDGMIGTRELWVNTVDGTREPRERADARLR